MNNREEILGKLRDAVVNMEEDAARTAAMEAIESGISADDALLEGLVQGMKVVGDLYERQEYFIPEVLICSDAMVAGLEILQPHLPVDANRVTEKVVIGVVQGDTHDIGKNLVKIMLETSGFDVFDLGRDVPLPDFIDKAQEIGARIIGMSTLMTTTMDGMKAVIDELKIRGIRDEFIVLVGGGPISQSFANEIGADLYASDATSAARKLKTLVEERACA